MVEIISIRFQSGGKEYYFNPNGIPFKEGDGVIVETSRGVEYARCVKGNTMIDEIELTAPLRPVVRMATAEDDRLVERNKERKKYALSICQQKIADHGLDMKLVGAEYSFDGSKVVFFFTSEGRVDFRALVKDLAGALHTRIELRQIGVRDEAKLLGGLGICGKPFCCSQFLEEFQPVSIKMAKTQNLSLNPTKISGTCGRLMCCLKYEQGAYEDAVKRCPKQESLVECPDGVGTVSGVNLLREQVKVRLEDSTEQPKSYLTQEIRVVRSGKGRRPEGYEPPAKGELEKLRTQEGEQLRGGRKLEGPSDLNQVLERYLGDGGQKQPEKQGGRRNRGHGKGTAQGQPRQDKAAPAKAQRQAQPKGPAQEGGQPAGAGGQNHKRRYRPHHRRRPGGGQEGQG